MKKIFYAAAVLAVISGTSCTKDEDVAVATQQEQEQEIVTLQVSVPVVETKTPVGNEEEPMDNEKKINSLQVYIFKSGEDIIDAYGSEESSTITINCTTGKKDIVVVANAPDMPGIKTKSELQKTVSDFKENALDNFVMYGETTETVTTSTSIKVEVTRFAARIIIKQITNNFTMSQYANDVYLNAVYLINVAGDYLYTGGYTPTIWYNKSKYDKTDAELGAMVYDKIDKQLTTIEPYKYPHYFYCYPNPTSEDSSSDTWSACYTRLVVEASIGGTIYYYPITIPNIERNTTYTITELILTRRGSESPDVPFSAEDAEFTITVSGWTTGTLEEDTVTI